MSRKQWSEIVRAAAISENLLERTRVRTPYKDFRVIEFVEHTTNIQLLLPRSG